MLDMTMDQQLKRDNDDNKNDDVLNEDVCSSQHTTICKLIQATAKGFNAIGKGLSKQYDEE